MSRVGRIDPSDLLGISLPRADLSVPMAAVDAETDPANVHIGVGDPEPEMGEPDPAMDEADPPNDHIGDLGL